MAPSSVSLIIPAYNCGRIIVDTIIKADEYLKRFDRAELIVVNDGSDDDTLEEITSVSKLIPYLRLINHPQNLGKGAAVRSGVLSAEGDLILFIDADLSTPISQLDRIFDKADKGWNEDDSGSAEDTVFTPMRGALPSSRSSSRSRQGEASGRVYPA
jgi:dolichyl-phosphate beta-glucosyltransferase